jgi:hypothetical protein
MLELRPNAPGLEVVFQCAPVGVDRFAGQAGIALDREPGPGVGLLNEQQVSPSQRTSPALPLAPDASPTLPPADELEPEDLGEVV